MNARRTTTALALWALWALWPSAAVAADDAWRARMSAMSALLADLVVDLSVDATALPPPDEAARQTRVRAHADTLSKLSHGMGKRQSGAWPDADPTLPWLAAQLQETTGRLRRADPTTDAGRDALLSVVATCVACHTRADLGPRQAALAVPAPPPSLPAWARADVLVATRRLDDASRAYRDAVGDQAFAARDPLRYDVTVRRALALEVRARGDDRAALALVDRVEAARGKSATTTAWRRTLLRPLPKAAPTPTAQLALAQRLLDDADAVRAFKTDDNADILHLRAAALLHRVVAAPSASATERADAYEKLGSTSEALSDLDAGLASPFYAACIEAAPRSIQARACFARYDRLVDAEWRGNGGAPLPPEVEREKQRLRVMSLPP